MTHSERPSLLHRLLNALLLTTALAVAVAPAGATSVAPPTAAVPADDEADMAAYASSEFTYCDAKLVAAVWASDIGDAKARIGWKIRAGATQMVLDELVGARDTHRCDWADTPHTYEDAELLAAYWGLPDPGAAKTKVAERYTYGRSADVIADLAAARQTDDVMGDNDGVAPPADDQADMAAFAESEFTYCDAKLVAAVWASDIGDAKARIGWKIRAGATQMVQDALVESRRTNACTWEDTGYSYQDAERLAQLWGVNVDQAKSKAADKVTQGQAWQVDSELGR